MRHVIGIDGGGTKTELQVADLSGDTLITLGGGSSNVKAVGLKRVLEVVHLMLEEIYKKHGLLPKDCIGICLGLAGTEQQDERNVVASHVRHYFEKQGHTDIGIQVTNDAEIALAAAFGKNRGVMAISGTGSIVFGIASSGEHHRTGGWGHLLGDKGSGYEIGLSSLQAVMLSFDGVKPPTLLTPFILRKLGLSAPPELRSVMYQSHIEKKHIAELAEACIQAAEEQDTAALHILCTAAEDLAALTAALRRQDLSFSGVPQGVTGSIFKHSSLFLNFYKEQLEKHCGSVSIIQTEHRPVYGAVNLALRLKEGP
ncbi:BadF/BadG/BcrA/BcrD ATPase family protein [Paenibacillus physcomitrellae]|uniref:N-acetylmuramic acid/N-acetylglucosamine kinase n=1 Tax=Paenibacillus physcomitrellae TaxID=1619311 RepID=A0ABQ1GQI4_9BACL|nr:BadF/BadG/BcrA/BcrD ATPase family protein [Paenibacillus physcomitrellae]GGA48413.1 N-acetylmuramic acid/N-acetylglucosamine kinase [Paenibacillus physcomitrellae]